MFVGLTTDSLDKKYISDERKLIQRLANGEEMAFEILFYRYRGKVGNFIKKTLPPGIDLEETVNEIFLRVWMNKTKLDVNLPLEPYLFRVARNIVIDEFRKNIQYQVYLQEGSFLSDLSIHGADEILEGKELKNWFTDVLKQLPEKRREIFIMSRFKDMTYREIAKKLNITENTVDTQIRRSLKYLRQELKKIYFFFIFF